MYSNHVLKLAHTLQVAESTYSCVVLALTVLNAFCPQVESQEAHRGLKLGWPQPAHLRLLQRQSHARSHSHLPNSGRRKALAQTRHVLCLQGRCWLVCMSVWMNAKLKNLQQANISCKSFSTSHEDIAYIHKGHNVVLSLTNFKGHV